MITRIPDWVWFALGLIVLVILWMIGGTTFLRFYLWAYLFYLGIALGSMAIVMMHHLTGGAWGFVIRRICEAAMLTLPLLALLFIPIAVGAGQLYPWADPARVASEEVLKHRATLYTLPWFWGRSIVYFAIWIASAYLLRRWSRAQDEADNPADYTMRFQVWCGPGLLAYVITISLASIDWLMSLEPHWASTIFGMLLIVGQGVSAFAFASIVASRLATQTGVSGDRGALAGNVSEKNWHDVGNLLFAFVLLWAYMAFSQYLISWNGNRVADAVWYQPRQTGGWGIMATGLIIVHFALPFVLLLFGGLKSRPHWLARIACLLLAARLLDGLWMVLPSFYSDGPPFSLLYILLPVALGILWLVVFRRHLQRAPMLPLNDPRLASPLPVEEDIRHA